MARDKDTVVLASISGKWVSYLHTVFAYCAFLGALVIGMSLHFHKIVKNEFYGYPQEWFPSVSATIGDRYPERSIFQIFIAVTSGPRFALIFLWYLLSVRPGAKGAQLVAAIGLVRTVMCGGWVYITSTDDHDWHDILMISYLVCTLPWTIGCIALSPVNRQALKYRKILAGLFFGTLVPLIYFYIQHKFHRVAGAYTTYAFFEWSLILFDVGFDAITALDFAGFEVRIVDVMGVSNGKGPIIQDKTHSYFFITRCRNGVVLADTVSETSEKRGQAIPQQLLGTSYPWDDMFDAAADIYTGYMFWSILTSLGVTVWYFPLWHMGISGYEVLIMTTISPFLLGISSLRRAVVSKPIIPYALSLSGLTAFFVTNPEIRLFAVGGGVFFSCLAWATSFWAERNNAARLDAKISAFSLGLIVSSISKFANHTNNPIWPIMNSINGGWNKTGLVLAILAILRTTERATVDSAETSSVDQKKKKGGPFVLSSIGLAGLLFGLHSLLSDSSTMITWVWEGYPIRGPIPVPHGVCTIAAMGIGFLIGLFKPRWATTWTFFGISSVAAATFYKNAGWTGYYGALVLAIYLMALIPSFISSATLYGPGRIFGAAFLLYNIIVLAHVWVVAYAFVPGGPLLRERTDLLMIATMVMIGCGVFSCISSTASAPEPKSDTENTVEPHRSRFRTYSIYALASLQLLAAAVAYLRIPTVIPTPYHPEEKLVTAGIWTVHFALDNDMWSSERRMRDAIKDLELDVIGLLESDLQRIIMGNRDMTQYLAEDLGMYADFGPGPNKHTWGCALLSKFPIINSTHHLLPSPVGELAPAILATLDMYGEMVDVLVFHSGQEEDVEDRRLQSLGVQQIMADSPRPLILLSYLVTNPKMGNYNTYVSEKSRMKDIDSTDWDRWCQYILYRGLKRIGYARVSRGTITDTEIQVGKFVVGEKENGDREIHERTVPVGMRFPEKFKGDGVRGHRYHVFDRPRYFA